MKFRYSAWCLVSAAILGGVSCKEKPKTTETKESEDKSVVESVVEGIKEAVAPVAISSLSVEERAAKLGFAKYLPKNTEMILSVYNAEQAAEQLKALELYKIIEGNLGMGGFEPQDFPEEEMLEDEGAIAPDAEQDADEDFAEGGMEENSSPWTLLGREITIGLGKTTGEQTGRLLTLNRRMAYFQAKAMGRAAQEYAKSGSMEDFTNGMSEELGIGLLTSLLEDPESGIDLLEKAVMPPLYIAFRAKDGELEQAAQLVNASMAVFEMADGMVEPLEIQSGGATFTGYKLLGEKIAETMEVAREDMEGDLSKETVDALMGAISRKNLYIVSGTIGEYVVMMISGTEASLSIASDVADSIVATDELKFADAFADKQLLSLAYGGKDVWDTVMREVGGISTYALGMRDGISGGDALGDTRDLEQMFQIIADREKAMLALGSSNDFGMVAYTEDGLKIESFGGYDKGAVNWDAKTTLSHLGDSGDNLMFINYPSNGEYDDKMGDYVESIFETAYALTMKFSALDIDAPELAEMKQYTQIFDEQFREDVVGLYGAISGDLMDGLGQETALIIDLKGPVPAITGIPQVVVDEGKTPRITLIAPVTDRAKLTSAWEKMNVGTTSILAKVSEMIDKDMPMLKTISSDSNGMKTWSFSMPFFEDNFMPSVTVSDKWFAASTSKTQAIDLMSKAEAGGEAGDGLRFYINFTALAEYADETLDMMEKNSAAIFTSEYGLEDFNSGKKDLREIIDACEQFDSLSWTAREENGAMHSVMHFKTK